RRRRHPERRAVMFGHVERVKPPALLVGFHQLQPLFVLIAGRYDAAVEMVECAELHRMRSSFRASARAVRSSISFNGCGVLTSPWLTQYACTRSSELRLTSPSWPV